MRFSPAGRRQFLAAIGALALTGAGAGARRAGAQAPAARTRIDTHHHVFPPPWIAELAQRNLGDPLGTAWSVAATLDDMDRAGVAASILSVTTPAVSFARPEVARQVARESNEWVARLAADHPGRFGAFAMLPMPDVEGSLREIAYALDVLKADGAGLLTSYGDRWLGHPSFAPVMAELNRRSAIAYTHPTLANCCQNLLPDVPPTVVEYGTDTSRTIVDLVVSGTAARCPNVRFIFSHGGGTLPFLTERLLRLPVQAPALAARVPNGVLHELQRFYYDTAWVAHPMALASLTKLVTASQILFGSDYPYRTGADHVQGLAAYGFGASDLDAIERGNARRLMPRFAQA